MDKYGIRYGNVKKKKKVGFGTSKPCPLNLVFQSKEIQGNLLLDKTALGNDATIHSSYHTEFNGVDNQIDCNVQLTASDGIEVYAKMTDVTTNTQVLVGQAKSATNTKFFIARTSSKFYFAFGNLTFQTGLLTLDNNWHLFKLDKGICYIDNVQVADLSAATWEALTTETTSIGNAKSLGTFFCKAEICYAKIYKNEVLTRHYTFSESDSNFVFDKVNSDKYTIEGANANRKKINNIYKFNILNGFTLYQNNTTSEYIRVPYNQLNQPITFSDANYTFVSECPAVKGHNYSENLIDFIIKIGLINTTRRPANWEWEDNFLYTHDIKTNTFATDYNIDSLKPIPTRTYLVGIGREYETIAAVVAHVIANATTTVEIILDAGVYYQPRVDFITLTTNFNFLCNDGVAILSNNYLLNNTPVWIETGVGTNTYTTTVVNCKTVFDEFYKIDNRLLRLESVASIALCEATPNSYFINSNTIYIHLLDGRVIDEYVNIFTSDYMLYFNSSRSYWMENIQMRGGNSTIYAAGVVYDFYAKNCRFDYSTVNNGISLYNRRNTSIIDSYATYNMKDGFNYHKDPARDASKIIEVRCNGSYNGWDGGDAHNGSTAHESCKIIRFGCIYDNNIRNVHDIDDVTSLNINCTCSNSRGAETDEDNFNFGAGFYLNNTQMLLVGCTSTDAYHDCYIGEGCTIEVINTPDLTHVGLGTLTNVNESKNILNWSPLVPNINDNVRLFFKNKTGEIALYDLDVAAPTGACFNKTAKWSDLLDYREIDADGTFLINEDGSYEINKI